jgi:high affinity Mn2+ porin
MSVAMSGTAEDTGATPIQTQQLLVPRLAASLADCSSATTICCRRGCCFGIEGDISFPSYLDDGIVASRSTPASAATEKLDFVSTVRGRVGYAFDRWLFYATGEYAWSQARFLENSNSTGNEDKVLRMRTGWALGAGAEVAIAPGWTARLEYLYDHLGKASTGFESSTVDAG